MAFASELPQLSIPELSEKSDIVIVGKVTNIDQEGLLNVASIVVLHHLKGQSKNNYINVRLQVHGGLKNFDHKLELGKIYLLYLRDMKTHYVTTQGGSIAEFKYSHYSNFETGYDNHKINSEAPIATHTDLISSKPLKVAESLGALEKAGDVLYSRGKWAIVRWFSPIEGIGHGDIVIYRQNNDGTWQINQRFEKLLLPAIETEGPLLIIKQKKSLNDKVYITAYNLVLKEDHILFIHDLPLKQ